jgi:cytidylate kinase
VTVRVVAIDGPAGSGKSTVARGVARVLGLPTLDTGAMYRAVTLAALEAGADLDQGTDVVDLAAKLDLELDDDVVRLSGRDVSDEIRGPAVTAAVSRVARRPEVREVLVARQRAWVAEHDGGVVEGRDIGTVVFRDAPVKAFLTADESVRARRRQRDEAAADRDVPVEALRASLAARDAADGTLGRATRPEDAAADALVVDTGALSADQVIELVVARAREAGL